MLFEPFDRKAPKIIKFNWTWKKLSSGALKLMTRRLDRVHRILWIKIHYSYQSRFVCIHASSKLGKKSFLIMLREAPSPPLFHFWFWLLKLISLNESADLSAGKNVITLSTFPSGCNSRSGRNRKYQKSEMNINWKILTNWHEMDFCSIMSGNSIHSHREGSFPERQAIKTCNVILSGIFESATSRVDYKRS